MRRAFIESLAHGVYTAAWVWGTILAFTWFVLWETAAFVSGRPAQDTYSVYVWAWLGTRRGWRGPRAVARVVVVLGLLWLAEHFGWGLF